MAIIIKDMVIPTCCLYCNFKYHYPSYCIITNERIKNPESKNDSCPLISVDEIVEEMDEMRSKDKIAEYPYIRCMDILRRLL